MTATDNDVFDLFNNALTFNHALIHHYDMSDTTFDHISKVYDWRNHVPDTLRASWSNLTLRDRMLIAIVANEVAEKENQ